MDRITEITLKTGQVGGITADERDEWHTLHIGAHVVWVVESSPSPVWPYVKWDNIRPIRKSSLSYLDHQAADRYLDAQRKPKVS